MLIFSMINSHDMLLLLLKLFICFYRELILTPEAKKAKLKNFVVSAKRNLEFLRIQMD